MSRFTPGQQVAIERLYNNRVTGFGTFLGKSLERPGYFRILIDNNMIIAIEDDRLTDASLYAQKLREGHQK